MSNTWQEKEWHKHRDLRDEFKRRGMTITDALQAQVDEEIRLEEMRAEGKRIAKARDERLERERAEQRERDLETRLADVKARKKLEFLAAHLDKSEKDFEQAWRERIRPLVVAEQADADKEKIKAAIRARGGYSW